MQNKSFEQLIEGKEKIAILVPNYAEYSGDARVVELQINDFLKSGKNVTLLTLNKEMNCICENVEMGMPKNLFFQRIYRLLFPLDLIKNRKYLLQLKSYDLLISHLYPMNWLCYQLKKKFNIPYVYWYHGIPNPKLQPYFYERVYLKLFILCTKFSAKNSDLNVSVSRFAEDEFKRYTGLDSIVIYNKPNDNKKCKSDDGKIIREKLKLHNDPIILNVGRVCPPKGAHLLIQAFKLVKEIIPNVKLIIVGKGTYDYYLKQLKDAADDSVIFTGFVSDEELKLYYSACDIYATCSLWETYNLPISEAQMCGKPVIAFDIGPHREIINDNGILVEVENLENFAKACVNKIKIVRGIN